jgi:uncharacterized membrane protein
MFGTIHRTIRSTAFAAGRLLRESFSGRLVVIALRLRRSVALLACFAGLLLALCVWCGFTAARSVFGLVPPDAGWFVFGFGLLAALLAFVVVLELCAATVTTAFNALLQLSYDTGRHIIGTLLTMIAILAAVVALLELRADGGRGLAAWAGPAVPLAACLTVLALWFHRAYRRPAYAGFRDFGADIVDARQFMQRAAHGR